MGEDSEHKRGRRKGTTLLRALGATFKWRMALAGLLLIGDSATHIMQVLLQDSRWLWEVGDVKAKGLLLLLLLLTDCWEHLPWLCVKGSQAPDERRGDVSRACVAPHPGASPCQARSLSCC